jgi:hypothetical protein
MKQVHPAETSSTLWHIGTKARLDLEANYKLATLRRALRPCFFGYEVEVKTAELKLISVFALRLIKVL